MNDETKRALAGPALEIVRLGGEPVSASECRLKTCTHHGYRSWDPSCTMCIDEDNAHWNYTEETSADDVVVVSPQRLGVIKGLRDNVKR